MNFVHLVVGISAMLFLQSVRIEAQQPAADLPETKLVLRVSREFIHELTAKQFKRDEPIEMDFTGTVVTGSAQANGTTDVRIKASDNSCDFDLIVNGQVTTQLVATSRSVQMNFRGCAPFKGRRRVVFDEIFFSGRKVEVEATYHSTLDRICSFRSGLIGVLVRGASKSMIRRSLAEDDLKADDEVRTKLTAAIEKESDGFLATLNKVGSIVKQGEELLREEKLLSARSVQHYLAATERSLYISVGPPQHQIARLPRLRASEREPIELWVAIRKEGKPDRFSPILEHWKLVKPFILSRIAKQSPESAKILDQVHVKTVEGWHVLTFAPNFLDSL
jgi:hypothetical protein